MRLKHLTLNGYKTFANKTSFEFADGVTAVIGPNGSGKSNVADSIRWALGEQQFSLLRGKKTDDMIFAGSSKRPRASMAEVLLTFDNSDGFFPVEFTEIAIGRRAYRDGSNEYLLNGNRVRLRDVTDLLGHTGLAERTYTVIGQGLVDTALTQRPEERRALFEEAAGIGVYRDRRDDALRKLEETHHNLERVRDILAEITPRLHQLERQANRARQYSVLSAELSEHTRTWFSFHYWSDRNAIAGTALNHEQVGAEVNAARGGVERLEAEAAAMQADQSNLRARIAEALPRRDEARRKYESLARNLAVMRERAASYESQLASAQRELRERLAAVDDLGLRSAHAAALVLGAHDTLAQRQAALDSAQRAAAERQSARAELEQARSAAQQEVMRANAALSAQQNRANTLRARLAALNKQTSDYTERITRASDQRDRELATLGELNGFIEKDAAHQRELNAAYEALTHELEAARAALSAAQSAFAAAEAEEKMASRVTLFAEMRAQQSSGDLADLAQAAHLPGLRGTVASLVQVLPEDQRAVEVTLGDYLKAIIIETDEGLTRTRAWLVGHKPRSARLNVVALPVLRLFDEARANADRVLAEVARGFSARPVLDSINAPDWFKPALRIMAGRAFIARDLDTARKLAARLPEGCACVTRDGEIVHATGLLSLPPGPRSPIILGEETAREKENELPLIDPAAARANRERAAAARNQAQRDLDTARRRLDEAGRARDQFAREAARRRSQRDDTSRRVTSLEEQLAQLAGDLEQIQEELATTNDQLGPLDESLRQAEGNQTGAAQRLAGFEVELRAQLAGGWMESLNAAHAAVATASEALRSAQNQQRERSAALAEASAQRDARIQRLRELTGQHGASQDALQSAEGATQSAEADLRTLNALITPVQDELAVLEQQLARTESARRDADRALRDAESRLNAITLDLARHNDELEALRERAADAFADENTEPGVQYPRETRNPNTQYPDGALAAQDQSVTSNLLSPISNPQSEIDNRQSSIVDQESAIENRKSKIENLLGALPVVKLLPEGLDQRMTTLRNSIKRLGAINFEAQAEYDELKQRHTFLTEQTADLDRASASLQQVIVELNDVMRATFKQTFEAIATAFQFTFKILFGGGQARLFLTNADAQHIDESGVEIHAQPPGKRPQALALLSGGERSLTAAALLFAILRVKPTPFCVLDEVDAALDEANVGRFRNMLEGLSEQTQFIVITHNRRTVEAANTVYGISMGADGASTALSLRLDEIEMKS